jgi:crotonobetainyl-CoA:carnitine CoA-transferase CaiB-like acyl-CoA transferase
MAFLDGYRVLDLTDARGLLAGRMLADLGADVVAAEPPEGNPARRTPPFLDEDEPGGDQSSLFWDVYGANRRGVQFDPARPSGRRLLADLAGVADVVIESAGPGEANRHGLVRADAMARNPGLVWCSISAFGLDGPKARWAESDLIMWAAGGPLEPHRDGDRAPLRISVPQSYLHAAADAAAGILLALAARHATGRGQHVDISAQVSLGIATLATVLAAPYEGGAAPGDGPDPRPSAASRAQGKWEARDGLVEFIFAVGPAAGRFTNSLFRWMAEAGVEVGPFAEWDWCTVNEAVQEGTITHAEIEEARALVAAFLATKTKLELTEAAVYRKVLPVGIFDLSDIGRSPHLEARDFWVTLGKGTRARTMPGRFAKTDVDAFSYRYPAPTLNEHTTEVAADWLGTRRDRPARAGAAGEGAAPFDHLKVLDLSWVVAGPVIGRALADFGATVVRVESSRRIETARFMPPFVGRIPDPEGSALYETCNAGKLGICLDLSTEPGRAVVRDLARWADVVVESFSPGTMNRFGLGPDALRAANPGLIVLSTALCGQSGPWSSLAGYGNVGAALAGFQYLVGWPDRPPIGPFGPYTDYVGPRFALVTLLAALDHRRRTGEGGRIDVSQVEAGVWFLAPEMAGWFATGRVPERCGNRDREFGPHGVYPCRPAPGRPDGWVAIAARSDEEWARLANVIGRSDLADHPRYASAEARLAAADELDDLLSAWTRQHTPAEVEAALQGVFVPAHRAAASADFCADPQLLHRGHLVRLPHPTHGEVVVEGPRYLLSETPGWPRRHAPRFHEDTDRVLRDLLGYGDEQVTRLGDAGILR